MVIASQIVSVLFSIFSRLQKTKTKSLILLLISNTINIISLILLDQAAGTFLTVATIIRTVIFFLYNKFNLKPSIVTLVTFELSFIIITGVTWSSSVDMLFLLGVMILTFATWQDNMFVLRNGMILNSTILIAYNILVGAYINIIGELFCLIAAIIAIIYYDIYKRTTPIIKRLLYYVKPRRKRKRLRARLRKR